MNELHVTELVKFRVQETTTTEELVSKADVINNFQKQQDGFIDAELVKEESENEWCLIYHFENMEKMKSIGEKMRAGKIFDVIAPILVPGSTRMVLSQPLKRW